MKKEIKKVTKKVSKGIKKSGRMIKAGGKVTVAYVQCFPGLCKQIAKDDKARHDAKKELKQQNREISELIETAAQVLN